MRTAKEIDEDLKRFYETEAKRTKPARKVATSIERKCGGWLITWLVDESYFDHRLYLFYTKKQAIYMACHEDDIVVPSRLCKAL